MHLHLLHAFYALDINREQLRPRSKWPITSVYLEAKERWYSFLLFSNVPREKERERERREERRKERTIRRGMNKGNGTLMRIAPYTCHARTREICMCVCLCVYASMRVPLWWHEKARGEGYPVAPFANTWNRAASSTEAARRRTPQQWNFQYCGWRLSWLMRQRGPSRHCSPPRIQPTRVSTPLSVILYVTDDDRFPPCEIWPTYCG